MYPIQFNKLEAVCAIHKMSLLMSVGYLCHTSTHLRHRGVLRSLRSQTNFGGVYVSKPQLNISGSAV